MTIAERSTALPDEAEQALVTALENQTAVLGSTPDCPRCHDRYAWTWVTDHCPHCQVSKQRWKALRDDPATWPDED